MAHALARAGAGVALLARTEADLVRAAEEVRRAVPGAPVFAVTADVADRAAVDEAARRIRAELGDIDILVNNAGMAQFGTVLEMEPDVWERL